MIEKLHWLGHSSFRWDGSKTVYFDPWKIRKGSKTADVICVSHEHFDHMSKPDIVAISTPDTILVTCEACAKQLKGLKGGAEDILVMAPGDSKNLDGVTIRSVASYNTNKEFHQKSTKKLGFIVTMDGASVYHAGDTDLIPEISEVECDIALLPISGTYVMTADEAAKAALAIEPKMAVPMHYGDIVGEAGDAKRFEDALRGRIEVKILRKED